MGIAHSAYVETENLLSILQNHGFDQCVDILVIIYSHANTYTWRGTGFTVVADGGLLLASVVHSKRMGIAHSACIETENLLSIL